jgi:hypothetical protein
MIRNHGGVYRSSRNQPEHRKSQPHRLTAGRCIRQPSVTSADFVDVALTEPRANLLQSQNSDQHDDRQTEDDKMDEMAAPSQKRRHEHRDRPLRLSP